MYKIKKNNRTSKLLSRTSKVILLIALILSIVGIVMVYSATLYTNLPFFQRASGKQVVWTIIGIFAGTFVFFIQKKFLFEYAYWFYGIGIALTLLPNYIGKGTVGTDRWLNLGFLNFQPSEVMKIIFVFAIARNLSATEMSSKNFRVFIIPVIIALIPTVIILKQPDLGTSMILLFTLFPMLFWAETRLFHIFLLIAPVISVLTAFNFYTFFIWIIVLTIVLYFSQEKLVIMILLFVFNISLGFTTPIIWGKLHTYQQNRILTMFNVNADPRGAGYQVIQSQVAIGSGGLVGKGIGQGTQTHLKFLPEQHTDFIFSVLGEEYGFIGVCIVLFLYMMLIILCFQTAHKLKGKFSSLVVVGLASVLFFHIAINVAMIVGLMPVTGLPLPFLSYGGTFMITCSLIVGLILNMSVIKARY